MTKPPVHFSRISPAESFSCHLQRTLPFLSKSRLDFLLSMGAIYLDGVRILQAPEKVDEEKVLRIHLEPKRYYFAGPTLEQRILAEDEEFLVLNKPAGIPVHPTLDNRLENCLSILGRKRGIQLYPTSRLDVLTRGLLVIAKTARFAREFNHQLTQGKITKTYHALTEGPISSGLYTHFMLNSQGQPRVFSKQSQEGAKVCSLEIEHSTPLSSSLCLQQVRLLTGRTHQIRGQLALIGYPVLRDNLYGSPRSSQIRPGIGLLCSRLEWPGQAFQLDPMIEFQDLIEKDEQDA